MPLDDRWRESENKLQTTIEVADFQAAALLLQQIVELAEEHDHHPDLLIHDYDKLTVKLTSHDAGKVTERDYNLATAIDELL